MVTQKWVNIDSGNNLLPDSTKPLPGARPTNDISIEFEIRPKCAGLWFKIFVTDHNEILHTSRQLHCRDVCKILLWSVVYILNWSIPNFDWILNAIEISLVGRAPDPMLTYHHRWAVAFTTKQFI